MAVNAQIVQFISNLSQSASHLIHIADINCAWIVDEYERLGLFIVAIRKRSLRLLFAFASQLFQSLFLRPLYIAP